MTTNITNVSVSVSDSTYLCNQFDKLFVVGDANELEVVLSGSIDDDLRKGARQTALVRIVEIGGWLVQGLGEESGRRGWEGVERVCDEFMVSGYM